MILLALQDEADRSVPISDNHWLDAYRIPFGSWIEQTVDWINTELQWLTDALRWPFDEVFNLLLSDNPERTSLLSISWIWIGIAFFLLGSFLRNTRVGLMVAAMVVACGFMGQEYWPEVARTFGMIVISVIACALIAIPWGVLCGRVDAVWNITRPTLDAMQVVHSFVWMIPFIFFFGSGSITATMLTMTYALPPLVRLTNLGIRQVPEDVVEASRAFGSSELRVLTEVQIPLARPAIMTGLNQTLLLAFSMLGIAAYAGAGGLGRLMFRAFNNADIALGAGTGLCFFLCAVVLDRISQPEQDDGLSLLERIRQAFAYRRNPEATYVAAQARQADADAAANAQPDEEEVTEYPEPVGATERMGLMVAAGASVLAIIATLLPWGGGAGKISSWGRAADLDLTGETFSGISSSGGSMFGVLALVLAALTLMCALRPLVSFPTRLSTILNRIDGQLLIGLAGIAGVIFLLNLFGVDVGWLQTIAFVVSGVVALVIVADTFVRGTPRLGNDGALICAVGALGATVGYLLAQPSPFAAAYSDQFGLWLALVATAAAVGGALVAMLAAPYASRRPIPSGLQLAALFKTLLAAALIAIGAVSAWVVDERAGIENRVFVKGLTSNGPRMGITVLIFGAIAVAIAVAVVLLAPHGRRRWHMGTLISSAAAAVIAASAAFTLTISRNGDADYFNDRRALTGAGVLISIVGAMVLFSIGRGLIQHYHRRRIYLGDQRLNPDAESDDDLTDLTDAVTELAGATR